LFISPDFFMPIVNQAQVDGENLLEARGTTKGIFEVFGHLKPGVTSLQAEADIDVVASYLAKTYPKEFSQKKVLLAHPGLTSFGPAARGFMAGMMLLAGLILLAACANLGGLFAARAVDRSREVALRLALGSSRNRILRGLLTEALLLSLAGGAAGLWGSVALLQWLSTWQPFPGAPIQLPVNPDGKLYITALALALFSGFLFGIVPVRQVLRTDPYQIVKAGSAGRPGRRMAVRDVLLAVQIAICAVLVTCSMVAVRGLVRALNGNLGFEPRNAIIADTNLAMAGYIGNDVLPMQKRMIAAFRTIPGVEQVGLVNNYPPLIYTAAFRASVFREDAADLRPSNAALKPYRFEISPGYLQAARTTLVTGRDFNWHDDTDAPPVAIVNQEFTRRFFGRTSNAVGQYFKLEDGRRVRILGVIEDGKYLSLNEDQQPAMFVPFLQLQSSSSALVVRSSGDMRRLTAALRDKLRELDPGLPVAIETWNSKLGVVLFPVRVASVALGMLGLMGAMLSITGIFGLAAYSVSRRLKELGIRMALGAKRQEILQAALGRALKLLAVGSASGIIFGILAARVLGNIVYQATPRDPVVLAAVVIAMGLLGLVATWIPAQRALSLDPVTLLREE
jgi:predicted permease